MTTCKECGHSLSKEAKYCPECGSEIGPIKASCSECGKKVDKDAKHCPHCGATFEDTWAGIRLYLAQYGGLGLFVGAGFLALVIQNYAAIRINSHAVWVRNMSVILSVIGGVMYSIQKINAD